MSRRRHAAERVQWKVKGRAGSVVLGSISDQQQVNLQLLFLNRPLAESGTRTPLEDPFCPSVSQTLPIKTLTVFDYIISYISSISVSVTVTTFFIGAVEKLAL